MPEGAVPAPEPADLEVEMDAIQWPVGQCRPGHPATDPERLRQRAVFLRELAEARALLGPGGAVAHAGDPPSRPAEQTTFWN